MASRNFDQSGGTLARSVQTLWCIFKVVGGSGSPTLQQYDPLLNTYSNAPTGGFQGISSISRTSAGLYVITLQDSYAFLLAAEPTWLMASGIPAAAVFGVVKGTGTAVAAAAPIVTIQFSTGGVATDPADGEFIQIRLDLCNSSAV